MPVFCTASTSFSSTPKIGLITGLNSYTGAFFTGFETVGVLTFLGLFTTGVAGVKSSTVKLAARGLSTGAGLTGIVGSAFSKTGCCLKTLSC